MSKFIGSLIDIGPYVLLIFVPFIYMLIADFFSRDSNTRRWSWLIFGIVVIGFLNHEFIHPDDQSVQSPSTTIQITTAYTEVIILSLIVIISILIADYILDTGFFNGLNKDYLHHSNHKINYLLKILFSHLISLIIFIVLLAISTYFMSMTIASIIFVICIIIAICSFFSSGNNYMMHKTGNNTYKINKY